MVRLKVTSEGQVTFEKELLDHLGVPPGGKVDVEFLPSAALSVRATPKGKIQDFFGLFKNETGRQVAIEDMNEAIAAGWAGEVEI